MKPLGEQTPEQLARRVYAALSHGENDARLLDGRHFKPRRWSDAQAALFELLRRLERASE